MFNNFFRKDLNLEKKWWHRALLSIYFLALALTLVLVAIISFFEDKQYAKIRLVSESFGSGNERLADIVKKEDPSFKIGELNYFSRYGNYEYDNYKDSTFCGKNITQGLDGYSMGDKKITKFMVRDSSGSRRDVVEGQLAENLLSTKVECITIDSFSGAYGERLYFIEPYEYSKEMWFYKYSPLYTLLNTLQYVGYALLVFLGILIFYYKVVLYVIYGK